jgi:hypothetical protein
MKKFYEIGSLLFDYMALTFILLISGALVLPVFAVYVGVIGFYTTHQTYTSIYKNVKDQYKNIWALTFILAIMIIFMILAFRNLTYYPILTTIIYIILGYASLLILSYAPVVIIHMNVTFKQLIRNVFVISIMKFPYTVVIFGILIFIGYLLVYEFIGFLILAMISIRSISYVSHKALLSMKEKDEK